MDLTADLLIDRLGLRPHPEGGSYVETWRAPVGTGQRSSSTAIYFLLQAGERSSWHTVDADEVWCHHAGSPLRLLTSADGRTHHTTLLGNDLFTGERPQHVVPAGHWQSAEPIGAWSLVSCIVAPGFSFDGFTLAEPDWQPG